MDLVAGIDAGTQSLKVVVYDPAARAIVASASEPLALMSGDDGSREQHPADWVVAMRVCFARLEPAVRARIGALAVSGQQHGFVPVDAAGEVLALVDTLSPSTRPQDKKARRAKGKKAGSKRKGKSASKKR